MTESGTPISNMIRREMHTRNFSYFIFLPGGEANKVAGPSADVAVVCLYCRSIHHSTDMRTIPTYKVGESY